MIDRERLVAIKEVLKQKSVPIHLRFKTIVADTLDEAAAQALLWILEGEKVSR